jgi:HK97 family phage portal protein
MILSRVFNSVETASQPLTGGTLLSLLGGTAAASGKTVTEKNSLGMPAVWRAVNLIAGTVASLPLHAYRTADGGRVIQTTGRAASLLETPHPDMTRFELWETVLAHMLLWGNAYLWIGRNQLGQIVELWPIHPSRVKAGRTSSMGRKVYQIDGGEQEHDDRTILHLPAFGYDGVCGVSPIRIAREGIGLALAAEEYGAKLFGSGSLATGILQTEQRLTPDQADILQSRWKAKRSGLGSAHETIVLDRGATFQQLTIPPGDAQFIESRRFQISEVARMFGVPPHMLMDTEKSTSWGSGIEQQGIGFVVYTLRPWLTRTEQRISRLLKPEPVYAKFSVEGLLRGDTKSRYEAYAVGRQWGWLSTNDIKAFEEQAPVEGGDDDYLVPLNMKPLGSEATLKERVDALGTLVRSGYDPEAACKAVGLDPIEHTGLAPVTVQSADELEPLDPAESEQETVDA